MLDIKSDVTQSDEKNDEITINFLGTIEDEKPELKEDIEAYLKYSRSSVSC